MPISKRHLRVLIAVSMFIVFLDAAAVLRLLMTDIQDSGMTMAMPGIAFLTENVYFMFEVTTVGALFLGFSTTFDYANERYGIVRRFAGSLIYGTTAISLAFMFYFARWLWPVWFERHSPLAEIFFETQKLFFGS